MKHILTLTLLLTVLYSQAQIFATTSAGKKVILNTDGTWKYADGGQEEKPCSKNHTGNITVKNATGGDIYFYYSTNEYGKTEFVKVKANASKTIYDLYVGITNWQGQVTEAHNYKWRVTPELVENASTLSYIKGAIETGSFMVNECESKEVSVGE